MLDSEAADNAESKASEVEQLRATIARYEDEHRLMTDEITQLKEMLKREVGQAEAEKKTNLAVINDYKLIKQRLEGQLKGAQGELQDLRVSERRWGVLLYCCCVFSSRKKSKVVSIVVCF